MLRHFSSEKVIFWLFLPFIVKSSKKLDNYKQTKNKNKNKNKKKKKKKTFLQLCLNMIFQEILAFLTKNYFFSLSHKVLTKKVIFCHFLKAAVAYFG